MSVLLRTTQSAEFVHRGDPAAKVEGAVDGPDSEWLCAEGQPAAAIRFRVRPLNQDDYAAASEVGAPFMLLVDKGLVGVSVGGEAVPIDELSHGALIEIRNLVVGVTNAPFVGRLARFKTSEAAPSSGTADGSE